MRLTVDHHHYASSDHSQPASGPSISTMINRDVKRQRAVAKLRNRPSSTTGCEWAVHWTGDSVGHGARRGWARVVRKSGTCDLSSPVPPSNETALLTGSSMTLFD